MDDSIRLFCCVQSRFLEYLRLEKRYSPHTVSSYERDLDQFMDFVHSFHEEMSSEEVQGFLVRNWVVDLMDQGYAITSVQRKLSTLKSYYRYLKRIGHRKDNPVANIISPKAPKRLPQFVDGQGMKDLFWNEGLFSDDFSGHRDRCMLLLFYSTGMRLSELIGLKESSVSARELRVIGKRNKERVIPIGEELQRAIEVYLKSKQMEHGQSEFLLVLDSGEKLYPKFVYRRVNEYLGRVTTLSKRSPHVLRHTFATHMLENGAELQSIKEILGHANLAATQVYTHNSIDRLKKIHTRSHPRG